MALSRVTPTGWLEETGTISRVTPTGWVQETQSAGGGTATGTLSATESGADAASLTGSVFIQGALTATETGADLAALTGTVWVQGAMSATESGADSASFLGSGATPAVTGTLDALEAADTASFAGNVFIVGTLDASEAGADTAYFYETVAVAEETPSGGGKGSRTRPRRVIYERIETLADFVDQVDAAVREEPKVKPKLRKAKRQRPETTQDTLENAQAWVDYYQALIGALRDQERARELEESLVRSADMLNSVIRRKELETLMAQEQAYQDEEDFLLLLLAA